MQPTSYSSVNSGGTGRKRKMGLREKLSGKTKRAEGQM